MNHSLENKERLLLARLLDDFRIAGLQLASYDMEPGAGSKPLAYIAVRAFRGLVSKYEEWLQDCKSLTGTPNALNVLETHNDPEYWVVRDAVMQYWLESQGYRVPRPPHLNTVWTMNGGFPKLVVEGV